MTDKLFDSFVKEKLKDFESEVPKGLWDKIMPEDEKKPVAIWWWNKTAIIIAIAITAGLGTTYFATKNNGNKSIAGKNIATKNIENNSNKTNNENKLINSSQITEKNSIANNNLDNVKLQTTEANNKKENNEGVNKSANEVSKIIGNNQKNEASYLVINNRKNIFKVTKTSNYNNTASNLNKNSKSSFAFNNQKNRYRKSQNQLIKEDKTLGIANNLEMYNSLSKNPVSNADLILLENKNYSLAKTTNKNLSINLGNLFGRTEDCPTAKGSSRNDFYIELYASPDYTFKKVINSTNGLEQYLVRKDSVEVLRGGFTIGGRISKSITNNLLLKVGLQYSQVNEEFRLKTENERRQTIIINSHTINRPGMSDTTISDTTYYLQIGYRVQKNMNYYRNLELPILLSYELGNPQDKWKLAINGGAIINLTSWYEGRTLDANYNMVSISTKSNNTFYKQEVGCSLYGGLSIMRKINDNVDVFAEPYFRLSLNKIESVEGFSQKFNAVGLQLGARINLNKNKHY